LNKEDRWLLKIIEKGMNEDYINRNNDEDMVKLINDLFKKLEKEEKEEE